MGYEEISNNNILGALSSAQKAGSTMPFFNENKSAPQNIQVFGTGNLLMPYFSMDTFSSAAFNNACSLLSALNFDALKNINPGGIQPSDNENASAISRQDGDFDKFLNFVLKMEGGAVATRVKYDKGGLTKKGITQATYNSYRKNKGLSQQSVANMTDAEMRDIYYNLYYKASGADKISDAKLALQVFDTAVNMGVGRAKEFLQKSGGDYNRFAQLRRQRYNNIAQKDATQNRFLKGWQGRVTKLDNFANTELA